MDEKGKMNTKEYEELIKEVKANSPYKRLSSAKKKWIFPRMLAVAKNLLIFRAYLDLTERIFRLPEFDLKIKKVLDNKRLNISVLDRD